MLRTTSVTRETPRPGMPACDSVEIHVSGDHPARPIPLGHTASFALWMLAPSGSSGATMPRVGHADGARRELGCARAGGQRDVEPVVHHEPALRALLRIAERERDGVDLRGGEIARAEMHGAARPERAHDPPRARSEFGVREDQVVGDGVDARDVVRH